MSARIVAACLAEHTQPDGTCMSPVWVELPQPLLPHLDAADGTLVAFAIVSVWAIGLKAKLVFRAARGAA